MPKTHRPGYQHQTPEPSSKGWQRVIARGCGLYRDEMNGDYDCTHDYTWACDECPVGIEAIEAREAFVGPPAPALFIFQ